MRYLRTLRSVWIQAQGFAARIEPCTAPCGSPNMPLRQPQPWLCARHLASSAGSDTHTATKSLYVMNVEGRRTLGPLLIGLLDYLERWLPNVGFFQVD